MTGAAPRGSAGGAAPPGPDAIRVLVVDDHQFFREGLAAMIAAEPDLDLIGQAATGDEAVAMAESLQPDVVLMDINMPGCSGVDAARVLTAASPHIRVLMVTMFEEDHLVFAAMRAGARGYLLKDAGHTEVLRAIRAVAGGEAIFSATIAGRLMAYFSDLRPAPAPTAFPELTEREREVLSLVARGERNAVIATQLGISPKTVRNHLSNILAKLQVADRAQAILRARDAGLA